MYKLITPTELDASFRDAPPGPELAGVVDEIISRVTKDIASYVRDSDDDDILDKQSRTKIFDSNGTTLLWVDAYPIDTGATFQLYYDTALPRVYGADTLLTSGEDYHIYDDRGLIELVSPRARGSRVFKLVWTGGLLTADATGVPNSIRGPAIDWARRLYRDWDHLGVINQAFNGASVSYPPRSWMPIEIAQVLPKRRLAA